MSTLNTEQVTREWVLADAESATISSDQPFGTASIVIPVDTNDTIKLSFGVAYISLLRQTADTLESYINPGN